VGRGAEQGAQAGQRDAGRDRHHRGSRRQLHAVQRFGHLLRLDRHHHGIGTLNGFRQMAGHCDAVRLRQRLRTRAVALGGAQPRRRMAAADQATDQGAGHVAAADEGDCRLHG
jgi:hypothetical protein